jgi:hypothetical protein
MCRRRCASVEAYPKPPAGGEIIPNAGPPVKRAFSGV